MRLSPVWLPSLLGTLVMAFAPYEVRPLLGAAQLFPGKAIQLAYRWASSAVREEERTGSAGAGRDRSATPGVVLSSCRLKH
jgi:hypothetical protein